MYYLVLMCVRSIVINVMFCYCLAFIVYAIIVYVCHVLL